MTHGTLDPITFEVVKHRLWQINDEQGTTIKSISTSPIVTEGNDFNVGLFTADGDLVIAGPYVLSHVTTMDTVLKYAIANAFEISDGDMYLINDPYAGALHQNDVAVVSPFFHNDELVLWIGNVLHHVDLAGSDEGSFCINAKNVFQEAPRYFLKVVRQGTLDRDVERTFIMNSRMSDMVALDLRAQVGAINVARSRIRDLLVQRSIETVLAVMERTVDYAEVALRERISELQDGTWSTDVFMDGDKVGSDRIIRVHLTLTKIGDEMHFDYTGTDVQSEGPTNATMPACYAGTTTPVYTFLCSGDIDWNGAVKRCVTVTAPEGTVMNARYPAAVSVCSIGFSWLASVAAMRVMSEMFEVSDKHRDRVCSSWSVSCNGNNIFSLGEDGRLRGGLLSDHRGCGGAARSFGDGPSHSGVVQSPFSYMSNVESQEWKMPMIYLFRRQLVDSGGPGEYRGGSTVLNAFTPYRTPSLIFKSQNTAGADASNAAGIRGGFPGAGSHVFIVRDTRVWENYRAGIAPTLLEELGGNTEHQATKSEGVLSGNDVFVFFPPGGGGYGDPLARSPELVRQDVLNGLVSVESAFAQYAVVLTNALEVDETATAFQRRSDMQARNNFPTLLDNHGPWNWTNSKHAICPSCSASVGLPGATLKWSSPLREAGPWLALRWGGHSPNFKLRQTACSNCGRLLDVTEYLKQGEDQVATQSVGAPTTD